LQHPKTVLPPPAGETRAVAPGRDALEIEFRGPPSLDAVFQLEPRGGIGRVSGFRKARRRGGGNFQVAGLFEVVVVSDEVRSFLVGGRGRGKNKDANHQTSEALSCYHASNDSETQYQC